MFSGNIDNINIAGIATCVPENTVDNCSLSFADTKKIIESTGVNKRHVVNESVCTSDLCCKAADQLLDELDWDRSTVDCVIFISQTPDYCLPSTAHVLQQRLNLTHASIVFDINLGCSGYVYGLWVVSQILQSKGLQRALLLVGDTVSKFVDPADRSTAALFGDAGSSTAIEKISSGHNKHFFCLDSDGQGYKNLWVKQGGCRAGFQSSHAPTLFMDGNEIFTFTLKQVPGLVRQTLSGAQWTLEEVDAFIFHQANGFMLNYLRKKLKLSEKQFHLALSDFGNTSSASIPLTLVYDQVSLKDKKTMLVGFGVGYSWGAVALDIREKTLLLPLIKM